MPKRATKHPLSERVRELVSITRLQSTACDTELEANTWALNYLATQVVLLTDEIANRTHVFPQPEPETNSVCDCCDAIADDMLFVLEQTILGNDVDLYVSIDSKRDLVDYLKSELSQFVEPNNYNGTDAVPAAPLRPDPHTQSQTAQGSTNYSDLSLDAARIEAPGECDTCASSGALNNGGADNA